MAGTRLTDGEIRHVARLARLRLTDEEVEQYRAELGEVLEHVARLGELSLDDVEPMSHPIGIENRLAEDVAGGSMSVEQVERLAPALEQGYIAVPKVLGEGEAQPGGEA